MSIFSKVKGLRVKKNAFNLSHDTMFTCDIGQVVPVYVQHYINPNTDLRVSCSDLSRFQALLAPMQHKVDAYIHFWKIPIRLLEPYFPSFISGSLMRDNLVYSTPVLKPKSLCESLLERIESGDLLKMLGNGSLWDMLGYPVLQKNQDLMIFRYREDELNIRPFLAYFLLFKERYVNLNINTSGLNSLLSSIDTLFDNIKSADPLVSGSNIDLSAYLADVLYNLYQFTGSITCFFNHAYFKDYFTSALPFVQVGDPVELSLVGDAPVSAQLPNDAVTYLTSGTDLSAGLKTFEFPPTNAAPPIYRSNGTSCYDTNGNLLPRGTMFLASSISESRASGPVLRSMDGKFAYTVIEDGVEVTKYLTDEGSIQGTADLSEASAITINEFRIANALQSLKEAYARFGTRFQEWLKGFWNQESSDRSLQLPQWLGGGRMPINVSEIEQTSATTNAGIEGENTPLGTLAGKATGLSGNFGGFSTHVEEPSIIIGLFFLQPKSVYGNQGLNRFLTKTNDLFDYHNPKTEHLGEQAVFQSELVYRNNTDVVFGYQSRYAEFKNWQNEVHGQFMSYLNFWHLGRIFTTPPTLNTDFIYVKPSENKRPFAVQEIDDNVDVANTMHWIHFEVHMLSPMSRFGTPMLLN